MLYNLIILNARSGITIANIRLAEEGITEKDGILMGGIVKAIRDFLRELEIGDIRTFQTLEKKIVNYIQGDILIALVCDENDNTDLYLPKIKYIAALFDENCDWDDWSGEITQFKKELDIAKTIIHLKDEEVISHISNSMKKVMNATHEIFGYKIIHESKYVNEFFRDIDDFELSSFFTSDFFQDIIRNHTDLENIISNIIPLNDMVFTSLNYGRFTLFTYQFLEKYIILLFLPGELNPIADLIKYEEKIRDVIGF